MNAYFKLASCEDAAQVSAALQKLASELKDPWPAENDAAIARALQTDKRSLWAVLAMHAEQAQGVVAFAPYYSTYRGGPGAMVSDLWVNAERRDHGLGPQLLAAAARHARALWGADFLRLSVYHENARAEAFYRRMGFEAHDHETTFSLHRHFEQLLENYP